MRNVGLEFIGLCRVVKPAPSFIERRAFGRRETNIKATVRAGHRMHACTIKDLSEGGALLEFDGEIELPPRLWLRWEDMASEIICEVRRHHGRRAGVEFARPIALAPRHTVAPVDGSRTGPPPAAPPPPVPRENVQQTLNKAAEIIARHRMRSGGSAHQAAPPSFRHSPPPLPQRALAVPAHANSKKPSIRAELASISKRINAAAPAETRGGLLVVEGEQSPRAEAKMPSLLPSPGVIEPDVRQTTAVKFAEVTAPVVDPPPVFVAEPVSSDVDRKVAARADAGPETHSAFLAALDLVDVQTLKAFLEFEDAPQDADGCLSAAAGDGTGVAPLRLAASGYGEAPTPVARVEIEAPPADPLPPAPLPACCYSGSAGAPRPLPASAYR